MNSPIATNHGNENAQGLNKVLVETEEIFVKLVNKNQGNDKLLPESTKTKEQNKVEIRTLTFDDFQNFTQNEKKSSGTCEVQKQEPFTGPLETTSNTANVSRASEEVPIRKYPQKFVWFGKRS